MALASIEQITEIAVHGNADTLELAKVLGFTAIVRKGDYHAGDLIVFIQPDTVLPDKPWAAIYKSKSNRVKAIKLRGVWSEGIVEKLDVVGLNESTVTIGQDVADIIGVTKYEHIVGEVNDLQAKGLLPHGVPKTDEVRYNNVRDLPFGQLVDVTLKVDGQSMSAYYVRNNEVIDEGVLGRTMEYKLEADNNYTRNARQYNMLEKLRTFCEKHNVNLCIRGESYGVGINKFAINHYAKLPLSFALFSVWLIDERRYARKGDKYYVFNIAEELGLPTVPMVEKDVVLTPELIRKYAEELTEINGLPFEGVVINYADGSFKVINKYYDSKK